MLYFGPKLEHTSASSSTAALTSHLSNSKATLSVIYIYIWYTSRLCQSHTFADSRLIFTVGIMVRYSFMCVFSTH